LKALHTLALPPSDIAKQISLKIKVHPGYPELELFFVVNHGLSEKILPRNSALKPLLKEFDLVVFVNWFGTEIIHILRAGMPVIFFWTDSLFVKKKLFHYLEWFLKAGILTRTPDDLWNVVRKFFTESIFAKHMRLQAQEFPQTYMDDSQYPDIKDVIEQILHGKSRNG
jgi:hypothetical protein